MVTPGNLNINNHYLDPQQEPAKITGCKIIRYMLQSL